MQKRKGGFLKMNAKSKSDAKGFTIIEVVLVLAIAGLIFLVVFLALPALQRGQRDSQRKADLGRLMSQVTAYQSNRQGALPTGTAWNGAQFKGAYLTNGGQKFTDPLENADYEITQQGTPQDASSLEAGDIWVYPGYKCDPSVANNSGVNNSGANARNVASVIFQEQGQYYCQDK